MPVLEKPTLKGTGFAWPVWISAAIFPRGIPGAEMYEIRSNAHQLRERLENRRNLAVPGITRPRQPAVYLARLGKLFPD